MPAYSEPSSTMVDNSSYLDSSLMNFSNEIWTAACWWATAINKAAPSLSAVTINKFRDSLLTGLKTRIESHWYVENPIKGQGYRALVCAETTDALLLNAAEASGIGASNFRKIFPSETVMWIDPGNVSYRHGQMYEKQIYPSEESSSPR
eukprot:TRINITY_DN5860_c0_g1_i2.p2 TRINITY_DN5860_c0_g1~~TRINITY_DN5860_c0_g1_i2.p2  ORF type:complete len:149 (-),score=23.09 TRINITY_DN5860_c0_g1_i2:101-547(-)